MPTTSVLNITISNYLKCTTHLGSCYRTTALTEICRTKTKICVNVDMKCTCLLLQKLKCSTLIYFNYGM